MKIRRLITWASLIFIADQVTKFVVKANIPIGDRIPVIPNIFDIVHVTNKGAAFGLFSRLPDPYRFIFLITVSVIAVGLIIYYFCTLPAGHRRLQVPLALILGGAVGNICDRIFRGEVIDFLSVHWYDRWVHWEFLGRYDWQFKLEWPAFNVADMAISLSVICLLVAMAWGHKKSNE